MKSILIVDDSAICREPIAAALRLKGYKTICAADGLDALAALEREKEKPALASSICLASVQVEPWSEDDR